MEESHTPNQQKVPKCLGRTSNNKIIVLPFCDKNFTGDRYLQFLQNELMPTVAEDFHSPNQLDVSERSIWFQQDGTTPHFARHKCEFSNMVFLGQ